MFLVAPQPPYVNLLHDFPSNVKARILAWHMPVMVMLSRHSALVVAPSENNPWSNNNSFITSVSRPIQSEGKIDVSYIPLGTMYFFSSRPRQLSQLSLPDLWRASM
jgi:hypothetical protein